MKRLIKLLAAALAVCMLTVLMMSGSIADAGSFSGDTDWGGGSDWGGSSDWGSGSSWDSGSDWDSDSSSDSDWGGFGTGWAMGSLLGGDTNSGGGSSGMDSGSSGSYSDDVGCLGGDTAFLVLLIVIAIVAYNYFKSKKQNAGASVYQAAQEEPGLPISDLKAKDPDFNEQALLEKIGNAYVQMQQAWQSKKWEPMRAIMTDSLFNQMAHQLDELKQKGLTNYVERIAVLDSRIQRYAVEGDNDVLVVRLNTRICDYTVLDKTGEVVSGSKDRELFMTYDWKLIRQKDRKTLAQAAMTEVSCPNCGAPLSLNQSGKCPYCDAVITLSDHDWALSVIKGISQRTAS